MCKQRRNCYIETIKKCPYREIGKGKNGWSKNNAVELKQ
jgi:hypothetical protein